MSQPSTIDLRRDVLDQCDVLKRNIEDMMSRLLHTEMDLNWAQAVVDGSWPNADNVIAVARERRKNETQASVG